jgi:sigma-B regulation protein RsbU (phosphoserine phosphatase)
VDLGRNENIPQLSAMLCEASTMTDPAEMMRHFAPWIGKRTPRDAIVSVSRRGLKDGQYKFTRVIGPTPKDPQAERVRRDPWSIWNSLPTLEGGLVWELIQTPEPKLLNRADFTQDENLVSALGDRARELRSVAVIPTYENGETINWALVFHNDPEWNDLESFEAGFLDLNMIGSATRNLVTRKKVEELNEELEKQFKQMGQIQRALTPASNPSLEGYELASSYKPSQHAGGDFFDYFQFPDGRLGVIIADVAGHGAAAATVMAMISASIRGFAFHHEDQETAANPTLVAQFVNKILYTSSLPSMFATAFLCVLDPRTGTVDWIRCGHNPPRIRGVDGTIRTLDNPGTLPLGITMDLPPVSLSSTLAPGETLVLYTDGITEAARPAENESGFEMFGEERMDAALKKCTGQPQCVIDTLTNAVREFTGSDIGKDDQTIVVVRHNHPDDAR